MEEEEFAKSLLAHERREWQNPNKIIEQIGIGKGMTVADLACGPGFFSLPLVKEVGKTGKVYAVDHSKVMLTYLRSNLDRSKVDLRAIEILESDVCEKTKIPDSSCDVVLFANLLHDLEKSKEFLREVKRISKPRGVLVDVDWKDIDNGFGPPLHIRMSEKNAKQLLKENGLTFVRNIDAGPYHYGLVLRLD